MATAHRTILGLLILQIYVGAAPTSETRPEATVENKNGKLQVENQPSPIEESSNDGQTTENQRQKRFFSHYGYGFPPFNPVQYPTYNKRDQASDLGVYGIDDPLSQVQKRLQEIASFASQPAYLPPPLPTHFPLFFPVIFVPQYCACVPNSGTTDTPTAQPETPQTSTQPPTSTDTDKSTTSPDIFNRWPEMEDERQNWGLVVNESDEYDIEDDFSRPISFDPIVLNRTTSRPVPPVEHGSNQAGAGTSTTVRPSPPSNDLPRPPKEPRPPIVAGAASFASSGPYPTNSVDNRKESPTTCDGAVLSCCHQPQITYDCFALLGCPDPTSYGNPCDPFVILNVIGKYQQFYGVQKG